MKSDEQETAQHVRNRTRVISRDRPTNCTTETSRPSGDETSRILTSSTRIEDSENNSASTGNRTAPFANSADVKPVVNYTCKLRKVIVTGDAAKRHKWKQICGVIRDVDGNLNLVHHFAITSNGLLSNSARRRIWPKLLDVYHTYNERTLVDLNSHKDFHQVYVDVQRSHRRFPPGMDPVERMQLQEKLTSLIIEILVRHPELHYYQGYHDICVTFLIEVGEELALPLMEKLSVTVLKVFMEVTMESTVQMLKCIWPLIRKYSPRLSMHLEASGVDTVFCLSWVITWFGHVLKRFEDIVRLYDFFLVSHRLMPVYLSAAIVLNRQEEILALEKDMPTVHHFLCSLPKHVSLEILVKRAYQFSQEYPPERLMTDCECFR